MANQVNRYGVFIASPSDVSEERDIVVETINRWNVVNWDTRRILFAPLRYETGAVPTLAATPQDAISEQLLPKADYLIGIFWSRLGTPTKDYPSGTVEEIETHPPNRTSVFFKDIKLSIDAGAPDTMELIQQYKDLKEWEKFLNQKGLNGTYSEPLELGTMVYQLLDTWANEARIPSPPIKVHKEPSDYELWLREWDRSGKEGTVLLYNIELNTFRDFRTFKKVWGVLRELPNLNKVILLLPLHKIRRLKRYLKDSVDELEKSDIADRFYVCALATQTGDSRQKVTKVTTGLAFASFRFGPDPDDGQAFPRCHVFALSEPFSTASPGETGEPELVWTYNYSLEIGEEEALPEKLIEIWDDQFSSDSLVTLVNLLSAPDSEKDAGPETKLPVNHNNIPSDKTSYNTIRVLREKLFDPNVPSYLLDKNYFILDWNAAFEMIFPTSQFYRKESILEFVNCLKNREAVLDHGRLFYDQHLFFDIESLEYQSPKYGHMRFMKIASEVPNPIGDEALGWIIALNVSEVENLEKYENDLKEANINHGLITLYAGPFDKMITGFPGYRASVDILAKCMSEAGKVLDLGAGPGILTLKLLKEGKKVTAVDQNDAMLDILRRRCQEYFEPKLSIVKANINTLHAPNKNYAPGKVGIASRYDGVVMLNVMRWLRNPADTLKILSEHLLNPGSILAFSLLTEEEDIEAFTDAVRAYSIEMDEQGEQTWSSGEYETFIKTMKKMEDRNILGRHTEEDMKNYIDQAGYTLERISRAEYTVSGRTYKGSTIFVTRSPLR